MQEFKLKDHSYIDRDNITISSYLHDINKYPLLTPEEEANLARQMKKGGRVGELAKQRLIEGNLRFVISVANQYVNSNNELSDLISEGNIGLIKAAETFDETKGFKFITYAVWWIRQSITNAIESSSTTFRLPSNKFRLLKQFRSMDNDMLRLEHRNLTVDEFCDVTGVSHDTISSILDAAIRPKQMDQPLDGDTDTTLGDMLASDSHDMTDMDKDSLREDLLLAVNNCLTVRDADIVRKYFLSSEPTTLASVAEEHNLSVERTRQVCISAMNKIRNSAYSARLAAYLAA